MSGRQGGHVAGMAGEGSPRCCQVAASQTRTVPSRAALASQEPSGANHRVDRAVTSLVCLARASRSRPVPSARPQAHPAWG